VNNFVVTTLNLGGRNPVQTEPILSVRRLSKKVRNQAEHILAMT
jgi:hypothetical protein